MGPSCSYCTLWADGFNGFNEHLQNRATFALSTPTDIKTFSQFADKRGWRFPYYSTITTEFQEAMGACFKNEQGELSVMPGVSTFLKKEGKVFRQTFDNLGPGDLYCSFWHLQNLLPKGAKGWQPQFNYN